MSIRPAADAHDDLTGNVQNKIERIIRILGDRGEEHVEGHIDSIMAGNTGIY